MLERLDQQLFLFLNSIHSPFCDQVMWAVSGRVIWVPLYLAILVYLGIKYKRKFLVIILMVTLVVTIGDQLSVLIKNLVQRPRPCHEQTLEGLVHIVKGYCGGLYSFVSSHATNSFSVALFSLLLIRKRWFSVGMIIWALAVGYSRIYLGVHYPGDVIAGSFLGALTGWAIYRLYEFIDRRYLVKHGYFNPVKIESQ